MRKVLHIVESFLRGSEKWIYPQVVEVEGVTPGVLCSTRANETEFPAIGCRIFDPPRWDAGFGITRLIRSTASLLGARGFRATGAVKRWKPDLIHAHFGTMGYNVLDLSRQAGAPLVTSFYGMDAWQLPIQKPEWVKPYAELFRNGKMFLVEGPAMRERLAHLGCPAHKMRIVRLGTRIEELPFDPAPVRGPLKVVLMADFIPSRGLEDGLAACVQAVHRGIDAEITIIGGPSPGDATGEAIEETLRALAKGPELEGRVNFAGILKPDRARKLIREHQVFLCPSKHAPNGDAEGGSPVALTEAMALGLLCIGTRHCDIAEVVRHEETGYLAEPGDIATITDLLGRAANRPNEVERLRAAGRMHIERNFSIANQLQELRAAYDACVETGER